jgi:hypothetical protein
VSVVGARDDYGGVISGTRDDPHANLTLTEAMRADLRGRRGVDGT